MSNVKAINPKCVTPEIILQHLAQELGTLADIYVVGIGKDGEPRVWSSGELRGLSFAALVLQDLALKYLNGCVEDG